MPQLTYSDVKSKVLKRERYKVKLTRAKTVLPIFKEDETTFSKLKGQKRYLRLVKFHVSLPSVGSSGKYPSTPTITMMVGKVVNMIKLRMTTFSDEFDLFTLIPPYNFLRGEYTYKTDTESFNAKSTSDSSVVLKGSTFSIPKTTLTDKVNLEQNAQLTQGMWSETQYNVDIPVLPQKSLISSVLTGSLSTSIPSNFSVHTDSKEIDEVNHQFPCVVYEFYNAGTISQGMKKLVVRSSKTSTAAQLQAVPFYMHKFSSDSKFDPDILSEIGYKSDKLYVDIWENLRQQKPNITAVDDVIKNPSDTASFSNTWMNGPSADIDKIVNLEKYFPFDDSTGTYDNAQSSKIAGRTDENGTTLAGLDQYLTAIVATLEFEIILVEMARKK